MSAWGASYPPTVLGMDAATRMVASIGSATSAIEAVATSIVAGIALGSFVGGVGSLVARLEPEDRDRAVAKAGCYGGIAAAAVLSVELLS